MFNGAGARRIEREQQGLRVRATPACTPPANFRVKGAKSSPFPGWRITVCGDAGCRVSSFYR